MFQDTATALTNLVIAECSNKNLTLEQQNQISVLILFISKFTTKCTKLEFDEENATKIGHALGTAAKLVFNEIVE
jgi:hypothetical protein